MQNFRGQYFYTLNENWIHLLEYDLISIDMIFSDFPLLTKKILELRTEHLKLMVEGMSLTTVFPIEADLDQKTFEYGKDTISNLEALDGAKTEEIETKDPLASALEASSLIDLN